MGNFILGLGNRNFWLLILGLTARVAGVAGLVIAIGLISYELEQSINFINLINLSFLNINIISLNNKGLGLGIYNNWNTLGLLYKNKNKKTFSTTSITHVGGDTFEQRLSLDFNKLNIDQAKEEVLAGVPSLQELEEFRVKIQKLKEEDQLQSALDNNPDHFGLYS